MKTVNLILGIHNHQPVGNFDFVFEEAYQKAYKPFLDILAEYPDIRISMHFTGIVLDWIDRVYPEFIVSLKNLVARGQVEMVGGGFYEPIMAVIPDVDKLGQIEKLSAYCEDRLGMRPRGMWVAERVWEPHLPKPLRQAGMEYIILDDTHFLYAGLREEELRGYFVTEEEGFKVDAFPISKALRYMIPFQEPAKTVELLRTAASSTGEKLMVFADDGEKFGIWPDTFEHVYEKKWLRRFFDALVENKDWIRMIHFSEAVDTLKPVGRVYIPTASYAEMLHWALPAKSFRDYENFENQQKTSDPDGTYTHFVRGGFWRNFSAKYPEINRMHKKMLRLSNRLQMSKAALAGERSSEQAALLETAQDHLWASQCNCPYWHGVFGGVYLNNIRYAMYKEMLICEKYLDTVDHEDDTAWLHLEIRDFDSDGFDEVLLESHGLNLYWSLEQGGSAFQLDYKDVPINFADALQRREEGYHHRLVDEAAGKSEGSGGEKRGKDEIASIHDRVMSKEAHLEEYLLYDVFPRHCFVDHFFARGVTLENIYKGNYKDRGDFADTTWSFRDHSQGASAELFFERQGLVDKQTVRMTKSFGLTAGRTELTVRYEVWNESDRVLETQFGTELNLTMLAADAEDRYYYIDNRELKKRKLGSKGEHSGVKGMGMKDEWMRTHIRWEFDREAQIWWYPVETVSMSEEGFERVYQNSCILPHWPVSLQPNRCWNVTFKMNFSRSM